MKEQRGFGREGYTSSSHLAGKDLIRSSHDGIFAKRIQPLIAIGELGQAEPLLRLLLQGRTRLPEVYYYLAELERRRGRIAESQQLMDQWLHLPAESPFQLKEQAKLAEVQGNFCLALERYRQLLKLDSQHRESLERAVDLSLKCSFWEEAMTLLRRLLRRHPENPQYLANAAFCALETGNSNLARDYGRHCMSVATGSEFGVDIEGSRAISKAVMARILYIDGHESFALELAWQAFSASSAYWPVARILAKLFLQLQMLTEASDLIDKSLLVQVDDPELHLQKSEVLLLRCELKRGFKEMDLSRALKRSRCTSATAANHKVHGLADIKRRGKLCLIAQTTLGDTLLFSRYAKWIQQETGQDVTIYVQPPLLKLLRDNLQPIVKVKPVQECKSLPAGTALTLLSAPAIFETCQEHSRLAEPHLYANSELVDQWRSCINPNSNELLVGINWHGSALHAMSERYLSDIPLRAFECLADLPAVRFISFQKGIGSEQLRNCSFGHLFVRCQDEITKEVGLDHMAAIMSLCDWIISDDSGPAHMAGNLGIPCIVLLPERINWRWGSIKGKSPWYPNTLLIRKRHREDWSDLVADACKYLTASTESDSAR